MDENDDPLWIRVLAFALAAAVASYGAVGLFLAIFGWYRLWLALVVGSVAFIGMCLLVRPVLPRRGEVSRAAHVAAVLAVVAIACISIWNASNASQQVLIIRDGGTYLNAGKWIASHGTLEVKPFVGPFSPTSGLAASSAGMSRQRDHLDFTLEHMFPALLAEAQGLGGDHLMFAMVSVLGGVALLAFYLLARRVLRNPIAALGAMLCLGLLMPQVSFSRDSTTEISIQVLVFTAAWLLCDRRTLQHRGTAFAAGVLLALSVAIHVDGLVFVIGLPFVALCSWSQARPSDRRRTGWSILFAAFGVAVGVALGWLDLANSSSSYLASLRADVTQLRLGCVVALVIAAGIAILMRSRSERVERLRARLGHARGAAGLVAALVVLVGGFAAWFVRPHVQTVRGNATTVVARLQASTHLAVDPTRRYFEHSVQWASWYLGPITLTLAIVGAACAIRAFFRGTLRSPSQVTVFILAPSTLLYLWRPSIVPDQIWAMRRFVPAVFPMLALAAFGALCVLARRDRLGWTDARRFVAVVLGVLAIAFPVYAIRDVSRMTQQRGFPVAVRAVCRTVGKNGAIVVPQELGSLTWLYDPQTLRSFCNVPVAIISSGQQSAFASNVRNGRLDANALRTLSRQWAEKKRRLFLVAGNVRTIRSLFPGRPMTVVPTATNSHLLVQRLVKRPGAYHDERLTFVIARVPVRS